MMDEVRVMTFVLGGGMNVEPYEFRADPELRRMEIRELLSDDRQRRDVQLRQLTDYHESELVHRVNAMADQMALDSERAIGRAATAMLAAPVSAQVDMTFSKGSIELAGTVIIWIAAAIGPSIQKELGQTIQTILNRTINQAMRDSGVERVGPMRAEVRPLAWREPQGNTTSHQPGDPRRAGGLPMWLPIVDTALLVAILVILVLIVVPSSSTMANARLVPPTAPSQNARATATP
jgi:hypothetical protein